MQYLIDEEDHQRLTDTVSRIRFIQDLVIDSQQRLTISPNNFISMMETLIHDIDRSLDNAEWQGRSE